jgi:hypothetical protein
VPGRVHISNVEQLPTHGDATGNALHMTGNLKSLLVLRPVLTLATMAFGLRLRTA